MDKDIYDMIVEAVEADVGPDYFKDMLDEVGSFTFSGMNIGNVTYIALHMGPYCWAYDSSTLAKAPDTITEILKQKWEGLDDDNET